MMQGTSAQTGLLFREESAGFVARFVLISLVLVAAGVLLGLAPRTDPIGYLLPGVEALLMAVAFAWRRREGLLAFAVFILFYDTLARYMGPQVKRVDELTIPLLVLIAGLGSWRSWRAWLWWPREVLLVVVLAIGVASSLVAAVPINIWAPELVLVTKAIALFYVAMWTGYRAWEVRGAYLVVGGIGLVVFALGLVELVNPTWFQETLGLARYSHPRGTLPVVKSLFFHPVIYAWFTAFIALYAYAQWAITRRRWPLVMAVLFSLGPYLASRRRAILGLAVGLLAGLASFMRRRLSLPDVARAWIPIAIANLVIVVAFLPALGGLYELTVERYFNEHPVQGSPPPGESPAPGGPTLEGDSNPQVRIALYEGSVKVAADYFPLGAGLGRYASWMSRSDYSPLYERYDLSKIPGLKPRNPRNATDTFWPQILGELGIFGFLAYLGFMACLGLTLWREAAQLGSPGLVAFRMGTGMIFAQALLESLASPMFHSPPRAYLVYLAVGMVAAGAWRRRATGDEEAVPARP